MKTLALKTKSLINYQIFRVALGIMLMFISAQAYIPLKPVPITLYSVGVIILGLCYQKKEAMQSIIGFILLGILGFPMFSGLKSGLAVIQGTSGGYLIGMVLCIYVMTSLREKFGEDSWLKLTLYSAIGSACLFVVGVPYLATIIGWEKAFVFGLYPFIIPGLVKAIFTASSIRLIKGKIEWQK